MAYLVAPGNHIAALGEITDASVGSDPSCTLGIRGDFKLEPVHFRIARKEHTPGAQVVPVAHPSAPVLVNGRKVGASGSRVASGDTITAGLINLVYHDGVPGSEAPNINEAAGSPPASSTSERPDPTAAPLDQTCTRAPIVGELCRERDEALRLPKRTAPATITPHRLAVESFRRTTVRWVIRAAVVLFFLSVGFSLLNARFPVVQDFWGEVTHKVKHILDPLESAPNSRSLLNGNRGA